jgi:hypothetical protein
MQIGIGPAGPAFPRFIDARRPNPGGEVSDAQRVAQRERGEAKTGRRNPEVERS